MCAEEFRDEKSERERTSVRKEINIEKFNSQNKSFNGEKGGESDKCSEKCPNIKVGDGLQFDNYYETHVKSIEIRNFPPLSLFCDPFNRRGVVNYLHFLTKYSRQLSPNEGESFTKTTPLTGCCVLGIVSCLLPTQQQPEITQHCP